MTDVFISYSRRDKEFTQKLVDALTAAGREVWADWESIPAASDWEAEIKEGIEKTNSVIFVLSPEWIKSNECRKEGDHALLMGKQLVPVLYQMVDPNDIPPELAKINWVYMRDEDDFEVAFETLCSAMDTDLDWVKKHTRLGVRALEWERKGRDNSFVLRGKDLTDGEQFIAEAADKNPVPTALQNEYILASRKDATRRQRITLAGVTVALIVSVFLGVVALFQWKEAARQAQISRTGELAALSQAEIDNRFDVAQLLGLEAYRLLQTPRTKGQLLSLANSHPGFKTRLFGHSEGVSSVAFLPSGDILATGSWDGSIVLWDVSNYETISELVTISEEDKFIYNIAISGDGDLLVSESWDGTQSTIRLWDISDPVAPKSLSTTEWNIFTGVSISPDIISETGGYLMAGANALWDINDSAGFVFLADLPGAEGAFSPNGSFLASIIVNENGEYSIPLWNVSNPNEPVEFAALTGFAGAVRTFAISNDGKILVSETWDIDNGSTVVLWDVSNPSLPFELASFSLAEAIRSFSFSPDDNRLFAGLWNASEILQWNISDLQKPRRINDLLGHHNDVNRLAFSPDGKYMASGSQDFSTVIWDLNRLDLTPAELVTLSDHDDIVLSLAFDPSAEILASGGLDSKVNIWYLDDLVPPISHKTFFDGPTNVDFDESGNILALGTDYDTVALVDMTDRTSPNLLAEIPGDFAVDPVIFRPDSDAGIQGNLLASSDSDSGNFFLWDISDPASPKMLSELEAPSSGLMRIAVNPAGNLLTLSGYQNDIFLWDIHDPANPVLLPVISKHTDAVVSVAFSPDGKLMASGSWDKTVVMWDISKPSAPIPLVTLNKHTDIVQTVAFNSNGSMLASGGGDKKNILWDLSDPAAPVVLSELIGHTDVVESLAFSPVGNMLASGSYDRNIILWDIDLQRWLASACQRAGRNFTRAEWEQYFPDEAYRKTCDQFSLEP